MATTKVEKSTVIYHADFHLDSSGQWLAEIDEVPQVHTFGRTLGKAKEHILDALALWLDVPVASLKGKVDFRQPALPDPIRAIVDEARSAREIAEASGRVAQELMRAASVDLLSNVHLSMRDAAEVLGLSHQRVQQLVAAHNSNGPRPPDPFTDAMTDLAKLVREYLPGGAKEDIGVAAAIVAGALALALTQSKQN